MRISIRAADERSRTSIISDSVEDVRQEQLADSRFRGLHAQPQRRHKHRQAGGLSDAFAAVLAACAGQPCGAPAHAWPPCSGGGWHVHVVMDSGQHPCSELSHPCSASACCGCKVDVHRQVIMIQMRNSLFHEIYTYTSGVDSIPGYDNGGDCPYWFKCNMHDFVPARILVAMMHDDECHRGQRCSYKRTGPGHNVNSSMCAQVLSSTNYTGWTRLA